MPEIVKCIYCKKVYEGEEKRPRCGGRKFEKEVTQETLLAETEKAKVINEALWNQV